MVHARQAVTRELLRDVRHAVARALLDLRRRVGLSRAHLVERRRREVRDASVQLAVRILVVGAAHRVGRVLRDAGHLERLAVVEIRVAAAVTDDHRVLRWTPRRDRERSARACRSPWCRRRRSPRPTCPAASSAPSRSLPMMLRMLTNSTSNGLPTSTSFSSAFPAGVVVAVDEAGHDGHALRVEHLRVLAGQVADVARRTDGGEAPARSRQTLRRAAPACPSCRRWR